ncbi:hypothetical protein COT12_00645 [Candidatus Berkelbacteria bacterium CG08_land_8_20_14_0_20_39_8]|uniref:SpoVT-AbrB domain-containing protein n=1 Tax=Candidatus Berkelbacteria bacterium CG08_land_8_20_14_0_20_39_8 TaxID=1974511 RepID=A0A2M6YCT4_9BACT|nr:MAG: hypothetical protein COT12_00645 [Candidatus Berkelbacteria bacterium CG08_land_8_20_14_0_20_39_8]
MKMEKRKLIKFSNYSLCVTLPKWVIKELKWQKGEVVNLQVDENKGEIVIKKGSSTTKEKLADKLPDDKQTKSSSKNKKTRW